MGYNPDTMSFELPETNMVYITGLPTDTSEDDLGRYFGSIGVIKIDKKKNRQKIHLYRDKSTGKLKGDGTVTYEDPFSAASAIQWFNDKEWKGSLLHVSLATRPQDAGADAGYQSGRGQDRGGGGNYGSGGGNRYNGGDRHDSHNYPPPSDDRGFGRPKEGREGDWICSKCSNSNFAFRQKCHKCQASKASGPESDSRAPQGRSGPAFAEDWSCPSCGNTNWAKRSQCNKCNTPKPGGVDVRRDGQGGGCKEVDEAEIEDARRRKKDYEQNDGDMYDEYGRSKKKMRPGGGDERGPRDGPPRDGPRGGGRGDGRPGQDSWGGHEQRGHDEGGRDRDRDRGRDRGNEDRGGDRDKGYNRGGDRDRDYGGRDSRGHDRDRGSEKESDRQRGFPPPKRY